MESYEAVVVAILEDDVCFFFSSKFGGESDSSNAIDLVSSLALFPCRFQSLFSEI